MPKKDGIYISKDQIQAYKLISRLLNPDTPIDIEPLGKQDPPKTAKKHVKGVDSYFLRPTLANDKVRLLLSKCLEIDPNLQLKHSSATADGNIMTCHSDVRTLLSLYLSSTKAVTKDFLIVDELLWSCLSDAYVHRMINESQLTITDTMIFFRRGTRGLIGSLAAELLRG